MTMYYVDIQESETSGTSIKIQFRLIMFHII